MPDPLDDAERRRLQRLAYGPGSTREERELAIDLLAAAATTDVGKLTSIACDREPMLSDGAESPEVGESEADDRAGAAEATDAEDEEDVVAGPPIRRRRKLLATIAVSVVAAVAVVGVVPSLIPKSPIQVFESAQSEQDREIPAWLDGALYTAAAAMKDSSVDDELRDSLRRVGDPEAGAYLFRDRESSTYCLAAAKRLDCAGGEDFAENGLQIETDGTGSGGAVRYSFTGDVGFTSEELPAPEGDEYHSGWSSRFEECVTDSGFTVIATPYGLVVPRKVPPSRRLEFALSVADCAYRYPDVAAYVGWAVQDRA